MIIPKTYKCRQLILEFLTIKRTEQQINKLDISESQFTCEEISQNIKFGFNSVDLQMNILWSEKLVIDINDSTPTKFMVLPHGMSVAASKDFINEGKRLNAEIFNKVTTSIFQLLTIVLAIITVVFNMTTGLKSTSSLDKLTQEVESLKELLLDPSKDDLIQKNYVDTTHVNQTNIQNSDTTSTDEKNAP